MKISATFALAGSLVFASAPVFAQSSSTNGTQTAVPGVGPGGAGTTTNTGNGTGSSSMSAGSGMTGQGTADNDSKKLKQQGVSAGNKPAE